MIKYENSLGITCLEPEPGYVLKKDDQTFKKVYLGKNDSADLYTEVLDKEFEGIDPEDMPIIIDSTKLNKNDVILISPGGKKFKLKVADDGTLETERI